MTGLNVATNTFICWPIGSVRKAIMLAFNFWSATSREQRSQLDLPPLETQTVAIATSYRIRFPALPGSEVTVKDRKSSLYEIDSTSV
jgi:hypothetical protein